MAKRCKTCNGRGRWQETEHYQTESNGEIIENTQQVWHECNDCHGTGVEQDPEAGDDYDIGGDSFTDDD